MTPNRNDRNETRLLLAVGGLVVAGAAGIALIAGLTLDDAPRRIAERSTPRASDPAAAARPALAVELEPPAATPVLLEQAVSPAAESAPVSPPFEIDPSEDPLARGLEAYASGDYGRAAAYFAAEVEARAERGWTRYMLALALWKDGRPDEAAPAMEAAARLDPGSIKARVNLARIRNDLGEFEAALEAAEAARAIAPADPSASFLAARSLFNLGRIDECLVPLQASLAADPDNGYAHNLLGLSLLAQQRAEEAVVAFETAATIEPQIAFVHNNLGMALELSGRRDDAVAAYRRSVELDPSHARAGANLARLDPAPCDPDESSGAEEVAGADSEEVLELASAEGEVEP